MKFATLCLHGARDANNSTGALATPVYQSATFAHPGVGLSSGYDYSRVQNPTRQVLEETVAKLEKAADALAFSSGMAALAALMELFSPGDRLAASDDLYGGSLRLFETISRKNGLAFDYADAASPEALAAAVTEKTKAVFLETPTNPMMKIADIRAARERLRPEVLLIVDNTFLTPYLQRPLELGADVVLHSGTKYLGGHNDALAGFLAVKDPGLAARLREISKTTGANLAPWDSFLILRGIKTLPLRMEKSQASALTLARWLAGRPEIASVRYPGLPGHPGREIGQSSGFGAMLAFETDSPERARRILERTRIILYAESLGGVETLITYPILQTHADVPPARRAALGITDRLLRLSVGVEDEEDLRADLEQALAD